MTVDATIIVGNLAPCVVALISSVADATLMRRLARMPRGSKSKLFVRQLWQLAISNLCYCLVSAVIMYYQFDMLMHDRGSPPSGYCRATMLLKRTGHFVNMAAEVHIALVFLAVSYKALRTLRCLRRSLLVIWPIGFGAAVLDIFTTKFQWDTDTLQCVVGRNGGEGTDVVLAVYMTMFIVVCVACYMISLLKVCRAEDGHNVRRRVWHRMSCYLLMALFINGPTWVYYTFNIGKGIPHTLDVPWLVSRLLLNFGGLFNFLLYAQQSRHLQRGAQRGSALNKGLKKAAEVDVSFNVRFRTDPSYMEATADLGGSSHGHSAASPTAAPPSLAPAASSEPLEEELQLAASEAEERQWEETLEGYYQSGFDMDAETSPSTMARIRETWQRMARV